MFLGQELPQNVEGEKNNNWMKEKKSLLSNSYHSHRERYEGTFSIVPTQNILFVSHLVVKLLWITVFGERRVGVQHFFGRLHDQNNISDLSNHCHRWQISLKFSCEDSYQLWTWYVTNKQCFSHFAETGPIADRGEHWFRNCQLQTPNITNYPKSLI